MKTHPKTGLVAVKLLQNYQNYNENETAGFAPDVAEEMVKKGVGKAVEPADPPTEPKVKQ